MRRFHRIGVFLVGSPSDEAALQYAGSFAEVAKTERIDVVYLEGGGDETDPGLLEAGTNRDQLAERIQRLFPESVRGRTELDVKPGKGVAEILRTARDDDLDLVIKGRRLPSHQLGIGTAFTKLARKSPCSTLIVPRYAPPKFGKLLVPLDLSRHSERTFETALAIARASSDPDPIVVAHSVVKLSYGYSKLGLSRHEAATERERLQREKLEEFVGRFDASGVTVETEVVAAEDIAEAVHHYAAARNFDMIAVGSHGNTPAASILGGTAEQILIDSPKPTLVVKEKGETISLLNALFGQ